MFKTSRSIDELAGGLRWTKVFFSVFWREERTNQRSQQERKEEREEERVPERNSKRIQTRQKEIIKYRKTYNHKKKTSERNTGSKKEPTN